MGRRTCMIIEGILADNEVSRDVISESVQECGADERQSARLTRRLKGRYFATVHGRVVPGWMADLA